MERGRGGHPASSSPPLPRLSEAAAGGQDCGRHLEAVPAPGPATNLWPPLALRLGSPSGEPSPFLLVPALPETQVLVAIPQEAHPAQDGVAAGKATASLGAITQGLTLRLNFLHQRLSSAAGSGGPPALSRFLPGDCPASGLKTPPGVRGWFLIIETFGVFCKHLCDLWLL